MIREDSEDAKIVQAEIDRLERLWKNAQERYGWSGSASTDRTMHKYDVLRSALENSLTDNRVKSKDKQIDQYLNRTADLRRRIISMKASGKIPADAADELLRMT